MIIKSPVRMEDELVWGKEDGAEETLDTLGPGRIVSKKKSVRQCHADDATPGMAVTGPRKVVREKVVYYRCSCS